MAGWQDINIDARVSKVGKVVAWLLNVCCDCRMESRGGGSRGVEIYIKADNNEIEDDNGLDHEPRKQKRNHVSRRPCQGRYIMSRFLFEKNK
jgi:hypothetical protein